MHSSFEPRPSRGPLAELHDLSLKMGGRDSRFCLRASGIRLRAGDVLALAGPSGSGKTLLLECLGLIRPLGPSDRYEVLTSGGMEDLAPEWTAAGGNGRITRIRAATFGFVPQQGGLLPFLSVRNNVRLTQEITGRRDDTLAENLIQILGLAAVASSFPQDLSAGQRQRVAIARALAHRPSIVIADEPTAALDPAMARDVMGLMLDLVRGWGAAMVIASHDHVLLEQFAVPRLALEIGADADGPVTWITGITA